MDVSAWAQTIDSRVFAALPAPPPPPQSVCPPMGEKTDCGSFQWSARQLVALYSVTQSPKSQFHYRVYHSSFENQQCVCDLFCVCALEALRNL